MKPLDHPDYEFAPGMFSFSRWSRENIPKPPPAHKVGDRVLVELAVANVYEDCDGTPLFAVGHVGGDDSGPFLYGFPNESLTPVGKP